MVFAKLETELKKKLPYLFQTELKHYNICSLPQHKIKLTIQGPLRQINSKIPYHYEAQIENGTGKPLNAQIIQKSQSQFGSKTITVLKKNNEFRMCIDFRHINNVTKISCYKFPTRDSISDRIGQCGIFCSLNAKSGHYQIAMEPDNRPITAF